MDESNHPISSTQQQSQQHAHLPLASRPPPAPPLPPSSRSGVLHRIIAPLNFARSSEHHGAKVAQSASVSPRDNTTNPYYRGQSLSECQTKSYRAGFDIAAVDINEKKTHAVLAGREILKIVQVRNGDISEELNLRSALSSSTGRKDSRSDDVNNRRQFLPAKDVRWSHGGYSHIVATAAHNGRIALYDVSGPDTSRMELAWLYPHTSQVNKLDFDPHRGYMLLSGSQDKTCKIWDIRTPTSPTAYNQYNARAPIRDVRWSPVDAFEFALCTENGVIQKWDVRYPAQAQLSINAHERACYTIGWHPDGKHLISGGLDKHLRVWDFKSDNRRQKPVFQLRTPQGIMNLAWRPPCWSSEFAEMGQWQSTQVATGYSDDDPRVHVWDLRRPLLPFREIDCEEKRPTDMLWASKDLLWTVGSGGMLTQTDLAYVPQVQDQLPPCTMDWSPDGSYVAFAEERDSERRSIFNDATASFLNIPPKKLSGEDGLSSHSLTDDDESGLTMSQPSRRSIKTLSATRSTKSLGNTPPTTEGFPQVLSLDKAVANRDSLFSNDQAGSYCYLDGITLSHQILDFLTSHFALPAIAFENAEQNEKILEQLQQKFENNANMCDLVSMHRVAQTWRIIQHVLIPELRDWAERNRKGRLEYVKMKEVRDFEYRKNLNDKDSSPFTKHSTKISETKSPARSDKTMSNLLREVLDSGKSLKETENNSNMTTPLAKPLPDSPATTSTRKENSTWYVLNDVIEPMPQLPPSVINAHATASLASKALLNDPSDIPDFPSSSAEKLEKAVGNGRSHKRSKTDIPKLGSTNKLQLDTPSRLTAQDLDLFSKLQESPVPKRTQEDMRAALKDYRAQTRPLFTLEAPKQSSHDSSEDQHGSVDSFLMFSTSTDSVHTEKLWGKSFDTSSASNRTRQDSTSWLKKARDTGDNPPSDDLIIVPDALKSQVIREKSLYSSQSTDFAEDESPELVFGGMDGTFDEGKSDRANVVVSTNDRDRRADKEIVSHEQPKDLSTNSKSTEPNQQHSTTSLNFTSPLQGPEQPGVLIHHYNPMLKHSPNLKVANTFEKRLKRLRAESRTDLSSPNFIDIDFYSIQTNEYEPTRPFAWSSLPLICQIIEFDQNEGQGAGLFSVHLIMHIYPFFFDQSGEEPYKPGSGLSTTLAERLINPELRGRTIENIFARHLEYLKRMKLYVSWAQIRKFCATVDYQRLAGIRTQPVGSALKQDQNTLIMQCKDCLTPIKTGVGSCRTCKGSRPSCTICESSSLDSSSFDLWCYCHKCGHSFHTACITTWFLDVPESQGQCPFPSCLCDCGPGLVRQQRFEKQHRISQESDVIAGIGTRSSSVGLKKDPLKASTSPAVDRARNSLRNFTSIEETLSGDEGSRAADIANGGNSRRRSSWSRTGGVSKGLGRAGDRVENMTRNQDSQSGTVTPTKSVAGSNDLITSSRRVRVVTPREEDAS